MNQEWKLVPVEPTQPMLDGMTTERKKGNGVLQMWFEALAAAPPPTPIGDKELRQIVTESLLGMISAVTSMSPPADAPIPDFIQSPIDRAVTRIGDHFTRLQAENTALQQRLTIADQRVDDLQHQQSQSLEVNSHSLRVVLTALVGAPHEIRELQACRGIPDNPIDQLLREYNAWIEKPTPATPQ